MTISQSTVIEHLQQDIKDIRVRLFDLIEQDHGVRPPSDTLCQVSAFFVAHVARRRTYQTRN